MANPTGAELFQAFIKYLGTPYEYGGWDCSQAIYQACLDVGVTFVDGSSAQKAATTEVPLETAPIGALGWLPGHDGLLDGAGGIAHAANKDRGTVWDTRHEPVGIIYAGLIPGIDYETKEAETLTNLVWPAPSKHITSDYDLRRRIDFGNGPVPSPHAGIDIRAPFGTIISSPVKGTIVRLVSNRKAGDLPSTGTLAPGRSPNGLGIRYGNRLVLLGHVKPYGHWRIGDSVEIGDNLGTVDLSGKVKGVHLHMEDWSDWTNPNSHTNFASRLVSRGSGTGTNPNPTTPPTEEDDMPYTPDELKQIAAEGALQALNGTSGRAIIRELIREQTDPIAKNAAAFMLGSWLGRGENRRTVAQAIASTDSDVEVILTMVKNK